MRPLDPERVELMGTRLVEASYTLHDAQVWGEPGVIAAQAAAPVQGHPVRPGTGLDRHPLHLRHARHR